MTIFEDQIKLTSEEIVTAVDKISQLYADTMENRAVADTRIRLTVEELLLNLRAAVGFPCYPDNQFAGSSNS